MNPPSTVEPTNQDLSSQNDWDLCWTRARPPSAGQLPLRRPGLHRDLHQFLKKHLVAPVGGTCCELGSFPGQYLRYTAEQWGLKPRGVEYVPWCASACSKNLESLGLECKIHCSDFRTVETDEVHDLVMSFGLIEHFSNTADAIHHHVRLTKPGGQVLIVYPLHDGIYGSVMNLVEPDRLAQHNRMSMQDGIEAVATLPNTELCATEFIGRFGFGSTRLHQYIDSLFPGARFLLGLPFRAGELSLKTVLPNTRSLATHAVLMINVGP